MNKNIFLLITLMLLSLASLYSMEISTPYQVEALKRLTSGSLEELDALGGDTACHIRALYNAMLYDKVLAAQGDISVLTQEELAFVTLSFMLTQAKEVVYDACGVITQEKVSYKRLNSSLSKAKGDLLIKQAQTKLSELSVAFLQEQASLLKNSELQQALSYVLVDDPVFKRKTVACYPSLKLILSCMALQERPLIIKLSKPCLDCLPNTHRACFFYKSIQGKFTACTPEEADLKKAAVVIAGYCNPECAKFKELCSKFQEYSVVDIALANAAAHPQFAGKANRDKTIPELKEELEYYALFAQKEGCCAENRALFCIDHIICQTVERALSEL